jgi:hypothetical protein
MRRAREPHARLAALVGVALAAGIAPVDAAQTAPAATPTEAPTEAATEAAPITSPDAPATVPAAPPNAKPAAAPSAAPANGPTETLYVIEQLVANVNSTPDASGERIATVKSGDRVELLERQHDQVHVRLSSGRDGWIRASFLSNAEPLRQRLTQRDAEVAQLREQVTSLQAQLGAARAAQAYGRSNPSPPRAASAEDPGEPPPGVLFSTAEEPRRVWPWALGAWLVGLALGAALGVLALDRHIRRRYGGLRIY